LSGFRGDFGACVGGKVYLLDLHVCLSETGDKALMECAYPELDPEIKRSSAQSFKPLSHRHSRRESMYSMERINSPFHEFEENSFRTRKQSAMEATKDAARATSNREFERQQADVFDQMMR
jgi:hypothetical protein